MIFDANLKFSDEQAITVTAASTNVIDLRATGRVYKAAADIVRDIGPGEPIPLLIQVVETFLTLTNLSIDLELDSETDFTPDKTIRLAHEIPAASLVAGWQVPHVSIPNGVNMRFARLKYTVGGSNATAGKITAGIVMAVQTNA